MEVGQVGLELVGEQGEGAILRDEVEDLEVDVFEGHWKANMGFKKQGDIRRVMSE